MNDFSLRVTALLDQINEELPVPLEAQEEALIHSLKFDLQIIQVISQQLKQSFRPDNTTFVYDRIMIDGYNREFASFKPDQRVRLIRYFTSKGWKAYYTRNERFVIEGNPVDLESIAEEFYKANFPLEEEKR